MTGSLLLQNDSPNGWIVQKFGGTSVGKFPDRIAEDIIRPYVKDHRLVVVCSARSTGKKVTGTTSRLLEVYKNLKAIAADSSDEQKQDALLKDAKRVIGDICSDHTAAADQFIQNAELAAIVKEETVKECQLLNEYLEAAKRFHLEVNSRAKDRVISFGEKLSCRFMAYLLRDRGVDAEYVDLADALHFDASIERLDATFYRDAAEIIAKKILACENRVPVVTGFFGNVPGGLLDGDVGRGYTDLCASLAAVGLKADELQIWKEVDGIFTADPSKVPTARLVPSITPSEAAELTFYGSEVIHHLTMDQVIKATPPIPIRIKNVKNPRGEGTIVKPDPRLAPDQTLHRHTTNGTSGTSTPNGTPCPKSTKPKRPTAVTIKDKISIINIHSNKRSIAHTFLARLFAILNKHRVSVDLISTSEVHVSVAVHMGNAEVTNFEAAVKDLSDCGDVSVLHGLAILSLVGAEMKNMIGISGKMFSTLGDHRINIEMISQGASEINISCVIDARDAERAMNVLHTNLFTFLE
ncbi:Aspartate/glutamate/uridylate kinase [Pseudoneurospora amorphoporcata]|uniref:Aspartokinase n=1 Tax=Pseudoneurospora amorphoporcata TaxID=241081 RepID=A0AAN6SD78_9PEZI|nr:Aspartate/glutamate/uridylate kinase [Pseudoneurospora amorphoporcata]